VKHKYRSEKRDLDLKRPVVCADFLAIRTACREKGRVCQRELAGSYSRVTMLSRMPHNCTMRVHVGGIQACHAR